MCTEPIQRCNTPPKPTIETPQHTLTHTHTHTTHQTKTGAPPVVLHRLERHHRRPPHPRALSHAPDRLRHARHRHTPAQEALHLLVRGYMGVDGWMDEGAKVNDRAYRYLYIYIYKSMYTPNPHTQSPHTQSHLHRFFLVTHLILFPAVYLGLPLYLCWNSKCVPWGERERGKGVEECGCGCVCVWVDLYICIYVCVCKHAVSLGLPLYLCWNSKCVP
jgi:hypothetical protein